MSVSIELSRLSWLLIPMAIFALAFTVLYHNRRSRANLFFSLFLFLAGGWLLLGFVYFAFPIVLPFVLPFQMICSTGFSFFFFLFTRAFVTEDYHFRPWEALFALPILVMAALAVLIAADLRLFEYFNGGVRVVGWKLHREPSVLYAAYSAGIIACIVGGLANLVRAFFTAREPLLRRRITVILVFLSVGLIGGFILNNVPALIGTGGYEQYSIIPILIALGGTAISLLRHKAWTIEYLLDIIEERNRTIESELDLARLIQQKLLPREMPALPGIDVHALYLPMDKVGGDYYDFHEGARTLDVIIADVTGHGIPGAFLAGITQTGFQFYAEAGTRGGALLERLDQLIARKSVNGMFVTASLVHFDMSTRELTYCRAGHCVPLLHRRAAGTITELFSHGRALGMYERSEYEQCTMVLDAGDRLVLYTDGLVEARNAGGAFFGEERLMNALGEMAAFPARAAGEAMMRLVKEFTGDTPMDDDVTMVLIDIG